MAFTIDLKKARLVIKMANSRRHHLNDIIGKNITEILSSPHKTYKYILVTALLSKATDGRIDILSLQSQDESEGAYNARDVAHEVIVKFERKEYPYSLGNSNEPFLNNPARTPRLSLENKVRGKKNKALLKLLINTLSSIDTSAKAFSYLCSAIKDMEMLSNEIQYKYSAEEFDFKGNKNLQSILDFISLLTDESMEGEVCPLIVSVLEQKYLGNEVIVEPHKVNEAGDSPREVGDIDVFDIDNKLITSIEVKDKDFSEEDVGHAIRKFIAAHLTRSMFIYGKNVKWDKTSVFQLVARIGRTGHYCCVISIIDYAKLILFELNVDYTLKEFCEDILHNAKLIEVHDTTIMWIKESLKRYLAE